MAGARPFDAEENRHDWDGNNYVREKMETEPSSRGVNVFISYSRKDINFAQKIFSALEARGLSPKIDTQDLPSLEDWRRELLGFISCRPSIA
jgi:hypothetical protein